MTLIIQKFGGTSVGNIENIRAVAEKIIETRSSGHRLVVVVSAMAGETDRLLGLAESFSSIPDSRELDVLLSTGEQVTIALLSLALIEKGCPACSYTGTQVPIRTDSVHTRARILDIDDSKIQDELANGKVVIIAGFQGVDEKGNITTLGRGGSDTTAVALAVALNADECQIFTDVEGIYTADPKVIPNARLLPEIAVEEMLEMASNGAKVMQNRAVEFAGRHHMPVRVLSTFKKGTGTLIAHYETAQQQHIVSGIAFNRDEAKLVVHGIEDKPGIAAALLKPLSDAHIEVDMIVQTMRDSTTDIAFTVHKRDYLKALSLTNETAKRLQAKGITSDQCVAKLSLVGMGMRSHAGIASHMFQVLGDEGINIQLISTSEIKVSVIIEEKMLEHSVKVLHEAFELNRESSVPQHFCVAE